MMHGRGKSDAAIVAEKPTNKAERSAAEPVEPRAVAKGNANQQSTQPGAAPGKRVTGAGAHTIRRESGAPVGPEVGAVCGKAARTDLCGGRGVTRVPTATGSEIRGLRSRIFASLQCGLRSFVEQPTLRLPGRSVGDREAHRGRF